MRACLRPGTELVRLEPYRLAREERDLKLDLPLDSFPRLLDLVVSADGPVAIRAHFGRDAEGRCRVTGTLAVTLRLRCGNCLEVEPVSLELPLDMCIVKDPERARTLIGEVDPLILEEPEATPAELFEDDLIMGLPERPCQGRVDCPHRPDPALAEAVQIEEAEPARRENPFAVLAGLKKDDGD